MGKMKLTADDLFSIGRNVFKFLNLLEYKSNKLSITNIAVWVCVFKIALAPQVALPEIGALMLALLNYAHKRHESSKAESKAVTATESDPVDLGPIQSQLDSLKSDHEGIQKLAEETKKLLSQSNLASAFIPRGKRGE